VDLSLTLATDNWFDNGIYLGSDDSIYARANNTFQVLSERSEARKADGSWKVVISCSSDCTIMQSASRRTIAIRDFQGHDHDDYILDASSNRTRGIKKCAWPDIYGQAITDQYAYHSSDGIATDARRWPLCDPRRVVELPLDMRKGDLWPLSDEALLLLGTPDSKKNPMRGVDLVTSDGKLGFHKEMSTHDVIAPYWTAFDERGERFAFTVETWRGGSRLLDMSGSRIARKIVVCNKTGQEVATIPVSKSYHRDFDFSLSPDGHVLAILDEGVLTIVRLE
jgi:hypothetical protein